MRRFHDLAIALSKGMFWACRKEWKPITPRPTERSRRAEYSAASMPSGAVSMKLVEHIVEHAQHVLDEARWSRHSVPVSMLSEDRQQTAVRSRP